MNKNSNIYLYNRNICKNADFEVWMSYPGPEAFGLSSLGLLWMYKQIDELDDVNAELIFTDKVPDTCLNPDMLGFSFSFELDFSNIFSIIENCGLKLKSSERDDSDALVFAGGPVVTANPEPYKNIFDFLIIGDGEDLNLKCIKICKENREKGKSAILKILSEVEGIYVPDYNKSVEKACKRLDECIYTPLLSENAFFKNTFILEIERGCANRCGFCLASYLNLPIRFVEYEKIIDTIELGLKYTNKIALLGAQITAHPRFNDICKYIYNKVVAGEKIEMGISSMRVDSFTPDTVKTLVACGQKNTTLAIEAGSERLRRVINKNLSNEQIFNAVKIACENGLKGLKFYGMIGLPTETYDDIDEMIDLAKAVKSQNKGFDISFGFSTFVPKPHTPFQWFGREDVKSLEKKSDYLRRELHKLGIKSQISSAKWDYWQAVLARGDSSLTDFLIDVYKNKQSLGTFKSMAKRHNIDTDKYALKNYDFTTDLPWDFIRLKPEKQFLIDECKHLTAN